MPTPKRKALGRGISALIPTSAESNTPASITEKGVFNCAIERLHPQRGQPRKRFDHSGISNLAISLRDEGVIQPLVVRPDQDGYEILAGERRWRAAQKAGLHEVPVIIRQANDREAFEIALVENLQREDLDPIEEAEAYARLMDDFDYTLQQVAQKTARDRSTIANSIRLLKAPARLKEALIEKRISAGHARALLPVSDLATLQKLLDRIAKQSLSVRQVESIVRAVHSEKENKLDDQPSRSPNQVDLEERLSAALKTRVRLRCQNSNRGTVEVFFGSLDELDRLLERFLN